MSKKKKIFEEAKKTVSDRKKFSAIILKAANKAEKLASNSPELQELRSKVNVLLSMAQNHISGRYQAFSIRSLLFIIFGLLYFIIPTDALPDFIPALGFTDDISVLFLIYRKLNKDIQRFLQWQETN